MILDDQNLRLQELMYLPAETEWIEFKEAKNSFDFNDLGKYFSALSNEANLKGQLAGWLIEGRRPNLFVSAEVAAATETKADYIRKLPFEKQHYKKMVEGYLRKFQVASRADFDNLLLKNLSDVLNAEQKKNFVTNLLQEMRRTKVIRIVEGKRGVGAKWELYNKD